MTCSDNMTGTALHKLSLYLLRLAGACIDRCPLAGLGYAIDDAQGAEAADDAVFIVRGDGIVLFR
jgi:hypothetical protein